MKKMRSVRMTQGHVSFNRLTIAFAREATVNVILGVYRHDDAAMIPAFTPCRLRFYLGTAPS